MITFRDVRPSDAERITAIYAPHVESSAVSFELTVPSISTMQQRIELYTAKYPWIVAEENGLVIGYAYASSYREREAYRYCVETSVYMDEKATRKGVASKLYDALFLQLSESGFKQAFAVITQPNDQSVAFHRANHFEEFALYEKVGYKFDQWFDVLWMRRWIP